MTVLRPADRPAPPVRDREITAAAWDERPPSLPADAIYRRRIGRWLLWRTGPSRGGDTTYFAFDPDDLARQFTFHETGVGPSGVAHERFRTWKEDLRDND
ncbi:MAG: hypothetical protein KY443_05095 [Actinobacteria bacterium]|nr:hypothetical protein [Actinomycetota bacterium]